MKVKITNKYKSLYEYYKDLYFDCSEKLHWIRMFIVFVILPIMLALIAVAIWL